MLSNMGKTGKFAAVALSAALSATLLTPAAAVVPPGAPDGTQDFVSNGKATTIFGSGSDTTYQVHQDLGVLFNRAAGCQLQTPISANQRFDMVCNETQTSANGRAPGFSNYDRDLVNDYYFIGSGGGRSHVDGWNEGTAGFVQADYFRSSSFGTAGQNKDARFIAYARDALATFVFDTVRTTDNTTLTGPANSPRTANDGGSAVPKINALTAQQVKNIFQGVTKCWASIDVKLANVTGTDLNPFLTGGAFDETKWATLVAAEVAGAGYGPTTNAYKACNPMAVYTVPTTSGTRQSWDSLAAGGSGKGQEFLTKINPFTGVNFTTAETSLRLIAENNATAITDRMGASTVNNDIVTNAIYFFGIGRYTSSNGGFVNGDPVLSGNSTKKTGYTDRLLGATRDGGGATVPATTANIASTNTADNYLYARSVYAGYKYPNQATRQYLDPVHGFLCTEKNSTLVDPINSSNARTQIEDVIKRNGFIPLTLGAVGGGRTGNSFCRQENPLSDDILAPSAASTVNAASPSKPVFTITFGELVSGVTSSSVFISEFSGDTAVGTPVAATLTCTNARQAVIPCLAPTSATNYDLSPLEYVKQVQIQPVGDLEGGKSYKAFALGRIGGTVAIQDRAGVRDWPVVAGNPLVNLASSAHAVPVAAAAAPVKASQLAASVPSTLKSKKKVTIPVTNSAGLTVKVTSSGCKTTPVVKTTKKKVGKKTVTTKTTTGFAVTMGKKGSTCTVTQSNAGDATYNPLNAVTAIRVN
jgi:hypothetical protein